MCGANSRGRQVPRKKARHRNRRGVVIVLVTLLIVVLIGFLALAIDVGYLCVTRGQLQRAADAGSLAGVAALYDPREMETELCEYRYNVIPPKPEAARWEVREFIGHNPAASRTLQVDPNSTNLPGGEIVIGCRSIGYQCGEAPPLTPTLDNPDSVLVRLPLEAGHVNGAARLFFAQVLGFYSADLGASAMATVRRPGGLLPFGMSETKWNSLATGGDGDYFAYQRGTGDFGVTIGSDEIPEVIIFPGDWNGEGMPPGNFGLLFIGNHTGGPTIIRPQIDKGVSQSDLEFHGGVLHEHMKLSGRTGLKSGNKHALLGHPNQVDNRHYQGILGQIRYVAVYSDATGNGSNAEFTMSKFVMVRIMAIKIDGTTRIAQFDTEGTEITAFVVQPVTDRRDFLELALTM